MGMGPFKDMAGWEPVGKHWMDVLRPIGGFLTDAVFYGPLITATIATVAGGIAYYSITVTRSIARKRAAIDFFLKTEADKSVVDIFQKFNVSIEKVDKDIDDGKTLREVTNTDHYKIIHTCLNIHELLAIGVANDVFDERVAYRYWSGALIAHCKKAEKLINFSRQEPDDYSAYIGILRLNGQWKKEFDEWISRLTPRPQSPIVVTGPAMTMTPDPPTPAPPGAAPAASVVDQNPEQPS
jgi:hypothetical protein